MDYAPQTFKEPCRILPHFKDQVTKATFRFALSYNEQLSQNVFWDMTLGEEEGQ